MSIYRRGKKKIYTLAHYLPGGQRVYKSLHTTNKQVAEYRAAQEIQKLSQESLPEPFRPPKSLQDALQAYLTDCKPRIRPYHFRNKLARLTRLAEALGVDALRALTVDRCADTLRRLEANRKWGPRTFNHHRSDLFTFLRWCEARGWLEKNPLVRIPSRKVPRNEVVFLSSIDIKHLMDALDGHWLKPAIAMGIYAGLRLSEIRRLEWKDIDFEGKTITVENKGAELTKSGKSRIIPLSGGLAQFLMPYRQPSGRFLTRSDLNYGFWMMKKRHTLPQWWNFLVFRHTFGTEMADAGVPLTVLQKWMGHSSPNITAQYYIGRKHAYDPRIEAFSPQSVVKSVGNT